MSNLADKRVSTAFLATLRDEPSTAAILSAYGAKPTRANIVKVDGLATAIARAEEVIRERVRTGSRPDIFEQLLTDDASGPALYQPYIPTPVPPRSSSIPPAPSSVTLSSASVSTVPPAPAVPSILVLNREAFFHPPPPPHYVPARPRRSAFGAFAIAFIAPLVVVALILGALSFHGSRKTESVPVGITTTNAALVPIAKPEIAPIARVETARVETAPVTASVAPPKTDAAILVVDVKSLKPAAPAPRKRR